MDEGAAASNLLSCLLILHSVCASGPVGAGLGRVKMRSIKCGLLIPTKSRHFVVKNLGGYVSIFGHKKLTMPLPRISLLVTSGM
jgi:hypothetical protein